MNNKKGLSDNPVVITLDRLDRWRLLIIQRLLIRPWRFNELAHDIPGLSQKVLTEKLRVMESDGIVIRTVYAEVPPHVEYALSELGETMRPILEALETWGRNYQKV